MRCMAFLLLAAAITAPACPQGSEAKTPDQLAALALEHLRISAAEGTHYARTDDYESDYFVEGNKKPTHKFRMRSEFVALNGTAYLKSAAIDGKKQSETQLQKSRDSFATHRAIMQANSAAGLVLKAGSVSDILTAAYQNRIVARMPVEGHDCVELESLPVGPITNGMAQVARRFWLDATTFDVMRTSTQTLANYDLGMGSMGPTKSLFLKGNTNTTTYHYVNGVPLPYENVDDTSMQNKADGHEIHIHHNTVYSDYQRFTATMTIVPESTAEVPKR